MKKLFLLDAYALIFRAYYAFINRPIRNSKGLNTSAIFGFVNAFDEVIRKEKPTHIAVAFDPPSPTFRHQIFEEYKANRQEAPEDIKLSVPYIKQILEAFQIPIIEVEGFEADDVIGTISKQAKKEGMEVYMMTPDKDYAQLVEEGIYMYKPRRSGNESEILGPDEVKEVFEVNDPLQVIDILALWGDSSDNIPGAPGIGEKTAKKLISDFGSVENLLNNTDQLKGKQKENLEQFKEQVLMSKTLATIDTNIPINYKIDELKIKEPDWGNVKKIFNELEFNTLSKRIVNENRIQTESTQGTLFGETEILSKSTNQEYYESFDPSKVKYHLIKDEKEIISLVNNLKKQSSFCFDTETTGLNVLEADIIGLAISFKEKMAYYIPFHKNNYKSSCETLNKFKELFNNETIIKIGHNIKFDIQILNRYNIVVKGPYFDTMVAKYLIQPDGKNKLDALTETILNYKMISIEELIGKMGKDQLNMGNIEIEKVKDYACEDADLTYRLYRKLKEDIQKNDFYDIATNIEMPLIEVLTVMELTGFNLDIKSLKDYEIKLHEEIIGLEKEIYNNAGEEFNIASTKQLGIILFEKLKISANTKMTKTKQYSTSEDVLQRMKDKHPIIERILDYRSLTKLQSTYVSALPRLIQKTTGRIHTSFNQTIAATGRLSSINPNLQNIPIREERGREIRKAFIPSQGDYKILSADYSQIELRLMAHMSGDEQMIKAFRNGEDIHTSTASKVYKVDNQAVTREMRSNAKTANFGIIYGISAFGLSQRLYISRSEAKELIDNYFKTYPKVKQYMDNSIEQAKKDGFVTTLYGRKRYLPDINSPNSVVRGVAERNAINSPIQGSAADIIKIAMIRIHNKLTGRFNTKMLLQVHDELVFDLYIPEKENVMRTVKYEMENAANLSIPLEVEMGIGNNWLEAH
ncbi:MAG: DNA polymerase I [Bacteroidales bacterium]|nr:DNA polymerase I [Bacteroidales bacterium]